MFVVVGLGETDGGPEDDGPAEASTCVGADDGSGDRVGSRNAVGCGDAEGAVYRKREKI